MSGRGDNNKHGTSGRGAGNQSNEGFNESEKVKKSYHGKETGGHKSEPEKKTGDTSANRNQAIEKERG